MSFLKKFKGLFHDDWCPTCNSEMELTDKQLFMLNETVSHYVSTRNPVYFQNNLLKVDKKSDIPAGVYACGIKTYWCSKCSKKIVYVQVFLPVRDQEKMEDVFYYENGELNNFLEKQKNYKL